MIASEDTDPAEAGSLGNRLLAVAKEHLPEVAAVLGTTNFKYTSLADRVCEALLNGAVTHWNHYNSESAESSLEAGLQVARDCRSLVRYAKDVACGIAVRERAIENLATVDGIISEKEMALIRLPIKEWLDRAYALLNSRAHPQARIDFVQESLVVGRSDRGSVISLLEALRGQGSRSVAAGSAPGDEVTQAASLVCGALMGHSVVAYNESAALSPAARTAAGLLLQLRDLFGPASDPRTHGSDPRAAVLPVTLEVWDRLQSNTAEARRVVREEADRLAINPLAKSGKSLPPRVAGQHVPKPRRSGHAGRNPAPASTRQGCLISGLVLAGVVFALVIASGDGHGPMSATDQERLPGPLEESDSERRGSGTPSELEFALPPVGTSRLLSMPELRWCVRQEETVARVAQELDDANQQLDRDRRNLELDEPRPFASEVQVESYNSEVDRYNRSVQGYEADRLRYNRQVDDYNGRCGSIRYRAGDLERARREVGLGGR